MADEIKITLALVYQNGQLKHQYNPGQLKLPQATAGVEQQTWAVGTSEEDISLSGNLTATGFTILQSLEATTTGNFVTYGAKSSTGGIGNPLGKLGPKQIHMFTLNSTSTLRAKADTAGVNVAVTIFDA